MLVRKVLHANVPASIVSIIDELLPQDRQVLRADARHLSVGGTAAIRPVAGSTGVEKLRTVIEVRRAALHLSELLLCSGESVHGSRQGDGEKDGRRQCCPRAYGVHAFTPLRLRER